MRITRQLVLGLLPTALLAVGCDDSNKDDPPDLYVVSIVPGDLATNVNVNASVVVRFSRAVDPASYTANSQIIMVDQSNSMIPITITPTVAQGAAEFLTLTPATPLSGNVTYGVAIREFVRASDGEEIQAPFASRFSTGAGISVIPGFPPFKAPPGPVAPPGAPGTFTATGQLVTAVDTQESCRLQSGDVLITGGLLNAGAVVRQAQVYSPATGTWRAVVYGPQGAQKNGLNFRRFFHTQTLLNNGTVLIAGGSDGTVTHDTAEIYDPVNDSFTVIPNRMTHGRTRHGAVKLDNGNVLLIGGVDNAGTIRNSMEVYDVSSGTFTATQVQLTIVRDRPTCMRQADGRVLITGGETYAFFLIPVLNVISVNSGETYSTQPGTSGSQGVIQPCGNRMSTTRWWHSMSEIVAGGASGISIIIGGASDNPFNISLQSGEVYDYLAYNGTGGFRPIAQSMARARWDHEQAVLASQQVLVTGGFTAAFPNVCPVTPVTELFDPFGNGAFLSAPYRGIDQSGTFTRTKTQSGMTTQLPIPPLVQGLGAQSADLLLNGTVLLAGGQDCIGPVPVSVRNCFIYSP